jgi:AAA15 family ATPase/GTPase
VKSDFLQFSAKIRYFKCFGELAQGFDQVKPVNLIIGRNNSGKSALLDLVEYLVSEDFTFQDGYLRPTPRKGKN